MDEFARVISERELAYAARRQGDDQPATKHGGDVWTFGRVLEWYRRRYPWIPLETEERFPRRPIKNVPFNWIEELPAPALVPDMDESSGDPVLTLHEDPAAWATCQKELTSELIALAKTSPTLIREITPDLFEQLVLELLASKGNRIEWFGRRQTVSGDGLVVAMVAEGIEIPVLVEAKRYAETRKVGVEAVTQLFGAMSAGGVPNGLLATSSYFRDSVTTRFGHRLDLNLVDYQGLVEWLETYSPEAKLFMHKEQLESK